MNNFIRLDIILAACMSLLVSCGNEHSVVAPEANSVKMTVDLLRPGMGNLTRTDFSENAHGDLECVWSKGDRIVVTTTDGSKVGELTLLDDYAYNRQGRFDGTLTGLNEGENTLKFFYIGNRETDENDKTVIYDLSEQDGILSSNGELVSVGANDCLFSEEAVVFVTDGHAYVENISLARCVSYGRFLLSLPDGISAEGQQVTVSGANVASSGVFSFTTGSFTPTVGDVKVTVGNGNEFYMTILPREGITPEFNIKLDGKTYTGRLDPRNWTANEYVRKDLGEGNTPRYSGQPVDMTIKKDDETTGPETVGPAIEYDGKKWRFVVGNLYYNTNTGVWGIHPNQAYFTDAGGIDYAGATKLTSPELIGHFAWGATGIENAQKPTTIKMNQWDKTCGGSYWPSTGSNNSSIKDLWLNDGVFDFGEAYMRSGRLADDKRTYRTPRKEMFEALFNNYFIQGCIIKKAGIDGSDVHGLIVLCGISKNDKEGAKNLIKEKGGSYNTSYMNTLVNHNNQGNTFDYNAITLESIDMLKNLDAIFFPAANGSNLNGGTIYKTDGRGYYWFAATSSTTNATNLYFAGGYDKAYGFFYNGNSGSSSSINQQKAVRLVVEVTE